MGITRVLSTHLSSKRIPRACEIRRAWLSAFKISYNNYASIQCGYRRWAFDDKTCSVAWKLTIELYYIIYFYYDIVEHEERKKNIRCTIIKLLYWPLSSDKYRIKKKKKKKKRNVFYANCDCRRYNIVMLLLTYVLTKYLII